MNTGVQEREGVGRRLPDGWEWVKLGDVCELIMGQSPPSETYRNSPEGLPFFQGKADFGQKFPTPRVWCVQPIKIAEIGDILISVRAPVGSFNLVNTKCCIGRGLAAIRPKSNADIGFIISALTLYEDKLISLGSGSTFVAINRSDLEKFEIPLPPLAEQKRIAAILNEQMEAVEKARKATEAQLEAAKELPAVYLRAVFNSPEAQKWERKALREICTGDGQYGTSELATSENIGLPILRMGNLYEGKITWNNLKYIQLQKTDEEKYKLQKGDIIFNRTNSAELVGKTAVFDGSRDAVFASYLIRFNVIETIANPNYISAYINSSYGRCFIEANMARAIGQVNISASTMHKMPIPLPALNQQEKIAQTLSKQMQSIDKLRYSLQSQLEAINQLPEAILRKAFNGEL